MNSPKNDFVDRKDPPKIFFFVFLCLYAFTMILTGKSSHATGVTMLFGAPVPTQLITGVYSSLANLCLICIVALYGRIGFFTSLILLICDFPTLLQAIFVRHIYTSLPGIFTIIFTIIAIIILYFNNIRIEKFQRRLKELAVTDSLTGLPNRLACSEQIEKLMKSNKKFALVMIDLNNFKNINDTLGHNVGNSVLVEVAGRWKEAAESGLSGTIDFISRQGGDEFMLLIQNYTSEEEVINTIQFYETILESKIKIIQRDYYMTASFGYAEYPDDTRDRHTLISYADSAMYEIKRSNTSNHILKFTPGLVEKGEHEIEIERKIRLALKNDTLFFQLQPQFDIDHNLRGFEALARMNDSDNTPISPVDFIPVAEKVGLIDKLDMCIFQKAAKFFGALIEKTHADICLSLNISVRHLIKEDFISEVSSILKESGLDPEKLEIEITESIMLDSQDKALCSIRQLKNMGVKIAIDDFGTGYSSLSYLNKIPADLLKIDKSFIDTMNSSSSAKQYVASIISIGHIMNFEVISEGVEQIDQLESLREIGCDMIQGFIWGKPMMPEDAEELIKNQ